MAEREVRTGRFAVVAHDLVAAMDTGACFARAGLDTFVPVAARALGEHSVVAVSTDSATDDPDVDYRKTREAALGLAGRYLYCKISSVLRGNIGSGLRALMDTLHSEKAVVCPAFPDNGRTLLQGKLLVDGIPVNRTHFASHPLTPSTESDIAALLRRQGGFQAVLTIPVEEVERGPLYLVQRIREAGERIVVVDAVEQVHLRYIAEALAAGDCSWLPCGSAGLARELPFALGYGSAGVRPVEPAQSFTPALLVLGSRNEVTAGQLKRVEACSNVVVVPVRPIELLRRRGRPARIGQLAREAGNAVGRGTSAALAATLSQYVPPLRRTTAEILAMVAARVLRRWEVGGLVLSGADTLQATCRTLEVTGIRVLNELQPGIAVGEFVGGTAAGTRIIVKSGGFGQDGALADVLRYFGGP
jgi:uncharacterized protein YgbK (DUF1537 family)